MTPFDEPFVKGTHPFIDYVHEDKSIYPFAHTQDYIDEDNDFRIGLSGGFLMNMDFMFVNTDAYMEVAQYHSKHKVYTHHHVGTKAYKDFWSREGTRRREGMTAKCRLDSQDIERYFDPTTPEYVKKSLLKDLRITGDHYNYLNYGRILRTPTEEELIELRRTKSKAKKVTGFPRFWDGDYWNFKIDEFVALNGFHLCKGKARRKGYSYKRGSQGANTINSIPKITIIFAAYLTDYLTEPGATTDMLKTNLDWYEQQTYWRRGYISQSLESIELGFKKRGYGAAKFGYQSKALSVSLFNNPSAPIGKDGIEIDYEEAGKCPNLQQAIELAMSATESGELSTGTIRVYGTGGAKGADWRPFSNIFYNCAANNMMPFENIYDEAARYDTCGFFHPQIWNYEPHMDEWGNSLLMKSFRIDATRKATAKKSKSIEDYILYIGQRANSPSEAFNTGHENMFTSPELLEHLKDLETRERNMKFRDGMLVYTNAGLTFKTNRELSNEGNKIHPYINEVPFKLTQDLEGCIREYHSPYVVDGEIPSGLYYVVIDPIGKDKEIKELTTKNSLVCIQVWMYPNNISNSAGDILVAQYVGRPVGEGVPAEIMVKLCEYYNAKALVETDRGTTIADVRRMGKSHLLYRDPTVVLTSNKESLAIPYGINIGGGSKAEDGLIYLKDMLYEPVGIDDNGNTLYLLHYISDLGFVKELVLFRKNGNFDRISCARIMIFQRIAYRTKKHKPKPPRDASTTLLGSLGLYKK
jgi:hypothetical protein